MNTWSNRLEQQQGLKPYDIFVWLDNKKAHSLAAWNTTSHVLSLSGFSWLGIRKQQSEWFQPEASQRIQSDIGWGYSHLQA